MSAVAAELCASQILSWRVCDSVQLLLVGSTAEVISRLHEGQLSMYGCTVQAFSKLPMRLLRQRSRECCVNTDEVNTAADSDSETIAVMFSTSESSPETVAGKFVRVSTDDHQQSGDQQQAPDHDDETESDDGNDFDQPR